MTFLTLARKNAWRKPIRTCLLIVCVAVAFLVFGLTRSFVEGSQGASGASDDILGVMSASGQNHPLPLAYRNALEANPDVAALSYMSRLRGYAIVEKNVVPVSAVDHETIADVNGKELGLTSDMVQALGEVRSNVLVGRALAEAQGWTVGQRVTVTSPNTPRSNGDNNWAFRIAGVFSGASTTTDTYFMIARYDYINASRARDKDTVDAFIVRPNQDVPSGQLSANIDQSFANSSVPTKTQSEKQFLEAFLRQYADIGLIVNLVVSAAFFTMLLIVVNTMLFAVRERTFEVGVLKTLGFSGRRIMLLILAETIFIFAIGGILGLSLAKLATLLVGSEFGLVFPMSLLVKAMSMITLLGLITGLLPAINALRIPIVSAFRTR